MIYNLSKFHSKYDIIYHAYGGGLMFKFRIGPLLLFVFSSFILGLGVKYKKATGLIYTNIINKFIREKLSLLFGKVDIPVGDILTIILILLMIYFLINFVRRLFIPTKWLIYIYRVFWGSVNIFCLGFFIFVLFYGLNYHTQPLANSLLDKYNAKYSTNIEVHVGTNKQLEVLKYLEGKAIDTRNLIKHDQNSSLSNINDLSLQAEEGFRIVSDAFPSLAGKYSRAKLSVKSPVFDILGLEGRYYILTNEVSISKDLPDIYKPFLVSKYLAYQRGIAREDEAMFFAYLAGTNNTNPSVKYSAYISILSMMTQSMMLDNKVEYNYFVSNMDKDIRSDMNLISNFRSKNSPGKKITDQVKHNFKRLNGDVRFDSLEREISILMASYYSLFTY